MSIQGNDSRIFLRPRKPRDAQSKGQHFLEVPPQKKIHLKKQFVKKGTLSGSGGKQGHHLRVLEPPIMESGITSAKQREAPKFRMSRTAFATKGREQWGGRPELPFFL